MPDAIHTLDKLHHITLTPSYSNLRFTSHQAVSAAAAACDPDAVARWRASPIFAVGSRTASDVKATFGIDPVGKAAGSARALGDTIVEYFARLQDCDAGHSADTDRAQDKPVLFMCSRIARVDLVDTLSSASISVEKVVAYDTVASADASAAVSEAVVKSVEASASSAEVWVAFFSPSGVEAVLPFLLTIPSPVLSRLRYAAIGSTTANALREGKLEAHAVASKPHPDALVSAIQESTTHEKKEHSTVS